MQAHNTMIKQPRLACEQDEEQQEVKEELRRLANCSYAPYRHRHVACTMVTAAGLVSGCTLENCAYPNSICGLQATFCHAAGAHTLSGSAAPAAIHSIYFVTAPPCPSADKNGATENANVTANGAAQPSFHEPCGLCVEFGREFVSKSTRIWKGALKCSWTEFAALSADVEVDRAITFEELPRPSAWDVPVPVLENGREILRSETDRSRSTLFDEDRTRVESFLRTVEKNGLDVGTVDIPSSKSGQIPLFDLETELKPLFLEAVRNSLKAYVPASHFPVGAALLVDNDTSSISEGNKVREFERKIVGGFNVEHGELIGLGLCAERVALTRMVAAGGRRLRALAVVLPKVPDFGRPCGACRQSLVEFGDFPVFQLRMDYDNAKIECESTTSLGLLPNAFMPEALE